MRIAEIKVYKFDELSDEAKINAIQNSHHLDEYVWGDGAITSLFAWAKAIGLEITDYSIDWGNVSQCTIKYNDKYVDYECTIDLNKGLTGYCEDYTLGNAWNKTKDIDETIFAFLSSCNKDYEYQMTDEYNSEFFEANDYEFTEDGEVFNY